MEPDEVNQTENWDFPLSIPQNRVKRAIKDLLGRFAMSIDPTLRKEIIKGRQPKSFLERAALMSVLIELDKKGESGLIAKIHRSFWASEEAFGYYNATNHRMLGMYELTKDQLIAALGDLEKGASVEKLIEIGCGEGLVLEKLSKEFPGINQFIGIDINQSQIKASAERFKSNPKLSFVAENAIDYIDTNSVSDCILLTFGGVMEYFTEQELKDFFSKLKLQKNIGIVLYEPLLQDFNPSTETKSKPYGAEMSFCHPYSSYLKEIGFHLNTEKIIGDSEFKWMLFSAAN